MAAPGWFHKALQADVYHKPSALFILPNIFLRLGQPHVATKSFRLQDHDIHVATRVSPIFSLCGAQSAGVEEAPVESRQGQEGATRPITARQRAHQIETQRRRWLCGDVQRIIASPDPATNGQGQCLAGAP
eukprot:scaffold1250_cov106-Isochrysis_galbana.AAC.1